MVFAFSVAFDVGKASNVIPIEKQHTIDELINSELAKTADLVIVISDNFEYNYTEIKDVLTPVAVMPDQITFSEPKHSYLDYNPKGHLKNKVNNFHLFYRLKIC